MPTPEHPPRGETAPATTNLRTLPQRLMPRADELLRKRWAQALVLVILVLPLAFLLGPSFSARSENLVAHLEPGARAEANIKATRDFDYRPSKEQLERQRVAAAKAVLPIFDHYADQTTILLARIGTAFRAMASAFAASQALDPIRAAGRPDRAKIGKKGGSGKEGGSGESKAPTVANKRGAKGKGKSKSMGSRAKLAADKVAKNEGASTSGPKLDVATLRNRFANKLQTNVSRATFDELRKARFSADVRAAIVGLVHASLSQLVISHRGALQPFAGKPVTVRHLVGGRLGSRGEDKLSNVVQVKDLQFVKEQLVLLGKASKFAPPLRRAVVTVAKGLLVPNLAFNPAETARRKEAARQAIRSRPLHFVKGQVLIRDGAPITKEHVHVLKAMLLTYEGVSLVQVIVGIGLFALIILVTVYRYAAQQFKRFDLSPRDLLMMGAVLLGMLALTRGVVGLVGAKHLGIARYLLPIAGGAMLVRLLVTAEAAAFFAVVAAGFTGLLMDRSLGLTLVYLVSGLVASHGALRVRSRSAVLRAGLMAGLWGAAAVVCFQMFSGQLEFKTLILSVLAAIAGGLLSAFTALALLPAIEWVFAYTTDITLLELANLNHPLLRELMLRAPGTYHHSMVVGNLAEAGCEAIGGNGLLARVSAYYHDVGKMKNAAYFAENFRTGDNPHNRLKASMSSLIIRSHVKDGIEMCREHGIPEPVIETASQHHGTAQIAFFYHKALEQKDEEEEIIEADYRYPGPKPQSREAGVIMVADGVEAAARSLAEPSDDRLQAVVQRIINTQFTDGQLDHCDLTLRDLHLIAKSFLQVLSGIYHARPTYPWQRRGDDTRSRGNNKRDTTRHKTISRDVGQEAAAAVDSAGGVGGKGAGPAESAPRQSKRAARKERRDTGPKRAESRDGKTTSTRASQDKVGQAKAGQAKASASRAAARADATEDKAESRGSGAGEGPAGQGVSSETPQESSPDIKRLGLN